MPTIILCTISLEGLGPQGILIRKLGRESLPLTAQTVDDLAVQAESLWRDYATGTPLPSGQRLGHRTAYARSLFIEDSTENDFQKIVVNNSPEAEGIENGEPQRDLKENLLHSAKARRAKDGTLYMYIPFRHFTPGYGPASHRMPRNLYRFMLRQEPSHIRSMGTRPNENPNVASPSRVPQARYHWGHALKLAELNTLGIPSNRRAATAINPAWKGDSRVGMYHFIHPTNPHHGQYLTFRTMSQKSQGWIKPATPGFHVAQHVADQMRPIVVEFVARAFQEDLQNAVPGQQ